MKTLDRPIVAIFHTHTTTQCLLLLFTKTTDNHGARWPYCPARAAIAESTELGRERRATGGGRLFPPQCCRNLCVLCCCPRALSTHQSVALPTYKNIRFKSDSFISFSGGLSHCPAERNWSGLLDLDFDLVHRVSRDCAIIIMRRTREISIAHQTLVSHSRLNVELTC